MSEAVDSFNSKINEIKEDREKFEILMDEFFDSEDINIKELLAEMMLHVIMTRGEELQIKFKELEDRRNLYGDWDLAHAASQPGTGGYISTIPTVTYPSVTWTYTTTDNTDWISGGGGVSSCGSSGAVTNPSDLAIVFDNLTTNIVSSSNTINVACGQFNISDLVEDIDLTDSKVNTKLFENAVQAMSTWSSNSAK